MAAGLFRKRGGQFDLGEFESRLDPAALGGIEHLGALC